MLVKSTGDDRFRDIQKKIPVTIFTGIMQSPRRYRKQIFLIQDIFYRFLDFIRHIFSRMCNPEDIVRFKNGVLYPKDLASPESFYGWIQTHGQGFSIAEFLEGCDKPGDPCRALVILQNIKGDPISAAMYAGTIASNCILNNLLENGVDRAFAQAEKALWLLYQIMPEWVSKNLNSMVFGLLATNLDLACTNLERMNDAGVPIEVRIVLRLLKDASSRCDKRFGLAEEIRALNSYGTQNGEIDALIDKIKNPPPPPETPHLGKRLIQPPPLNSLPNNLPKN